MYVLYYLGIIFLLQSRQPYLSQTQNQEVLAINVLIISLNNLKYEFKIAIKLKANLVPET